MLAGRTTTMMTMIDADDSNERRGCIVYTDLLPVATPLLFNSGLKSLAETAIDESVFRWHVSAE